MKVFQVTPYVPGVETHGEGHKECGAIAVEGAVAWTDARDWL